MDTELNILLGRAIDSLVKLEILLYLHGRKGGAQTTEELGASLRRPLPEVASALDQLARAGLIERFPIGRGRHSVYGTTEDAHVEALLELLSRRYHQGPDARSQLVRQVLRADRDEDPDIAPDSS